MSTAHKPTYHPAVAGSHAGGFRYHAGRIQRASRDQIAHTKLKFRQLGQASQLETINKYKHQKKDNDKVNNNKQQEEVTDDNNDEFRNRKRRRGSLESEDELNDNRDSSKERNVDDGVVSGVSDVNANGDNNANDISDVLSHPIDLSSYDLSRFDDEDDTNIKLDPKDKRFTNDHDSNNSIDKENHGTNNDNDNDNEEDDDEAELQLELEKIRAEREKEKNKQITDNHISPSLPSSSSLVSSSSSYHRVDGVSSPDNIRWDSDVVFRHQISSDMKVNEKRFLNDTIRSDFHRKFMKKYIK